MLGLNASWKPYSLHFKQPAVTSRGALTDKPGYYLALMSEGGHYGVGECSLLPGLSPDGQGDLVAALDQVCNAIATAQSTEVAIPTAFPALRFAVEQAGLALRHPQGPIFSTPFTQEGAGIAINGLIWMADRRSMQAQIRRKLDEGYRCIKLKIGALDFEEELRLLSEIRREYGASEVELRVDANGAFRVDEALEKLQRLAALELHSIEQPIAPGQYESMAHLVAASPLPIALDEELIGVHAPGDRVALLEQVKPHYLILKPSLLGGFAEAEEWIALAEARGIGWWVTSALESNLGLNLLAQWCAGLGNPMPQGLGTGLLYTNNLPTPLSIRQGRLYYDLTFDPSDYGRFYADV